MTFKVYDEDAQKRAWENENNAIESGIMGAAYTTIGGVAMGYTIASLKKGVSFWTLVSAFVSGSLLTSGLKSLNNTRHLLERSKELREQARQDMNNPVIAEVKDEADIVDVETGSDPE